MVRLNVIYTRTGDAGETGLGDGSRRPKWDARVAAMGDVDEANCAVGLARLATARPADETLASIETMLARVQNDLFDLGADLCLPRKADEAPGAALRIQPSQVEAIERAIDALNERPRAAALVRAARRDGRVGRAASGPRSLPAGRAQHGRAGGDRGRGGRRGGARLCQPPVRLSLRRRARRQRRRQGRCAVGAGAGAEQAETR